MKGEDALSIASLIFNSREFSKVILSNIKTKTKKTRLLTFQEFAHVFVWKK